MSTIKEVSRRAQVSPATVSRVLNGSAPVANGTKKRVLDAVEKLNYQPNAFARGLVTNRSGGIGVVVNEISSPYYSGIVRGIENVIEASGMHLIVSSGHADEKFERKAAGYLLQRRSDALILHLETMSDVELLGWLEQNLPAETPVVIMGRHVSELGNRCIYLDNEKGGFLATQHLLERGHEHIAHITGPLAMKDSRDRLQGYRRALESVWTDEVFDAPQEFLDGQQARQLYVNVVNNIQGTFTHPGDVVAAEVVTNALTSVLNEGADIDAALSDAEQIIQRRVR